MMRLNFIIVNKLDAGESLPNYIVQNELPVQQLL